MGDLKGVAILDSGNNWRTAISPLYAQKLGLNLITDLVPIKGMTSVGTAKQGGQMKVLGETRQYFHLKLSTCDTKFKLKFAVIGV